MDKARAGSQSVEAGFALQETSMPPGAAPVKRLMALGIAVLVAHIVILQGTSMALNLNASPVSRPFTTRTIELAPEAPQAAIASTPAPAAAAPRKKRPLPPAADPAPVQASNTETAPADPAQVATDSIASIAPASPDPELAPPESGPEPVPPPPPPPQAPPPAPYTVPGSLRIKYNISGEIKSLPYWARAELLWLQDGDTYDARLEVGAFLLGSRVQTSAGRITANGLEPRRFSDKVRSEVAAHFERDKGKVIFSANTPDVALLSGAQDQLSIFVQLGAMIAGRPAQYPPGTTIAMQAVGARDADTWAFTIGGHEQLNLPGGELAALKLTRPPRQAYDLKVELWLAPQMGYLPVRIRLTQDNGDFIDQQWRTSDPP